MGRLRVVGWTDYDNRKYDGTVFRTDRQFRRACKAVAAEIRERGLSFTGEYHQYGRNGAPLLSDGTLFRVSQRTWGHVMATAHGMTGDMDYVNWYLGPVENERFPSKEAT